MNAIELFVNNMFSGYRQTPEMRRVKAEMLSNMQEKYQDLRREGKTDNEAIGIVINSFGSVEELAESLGVELTPEGEVDDMPIATQEEVNAFVEDSQMSAEKISRGVVCCILSPLLLIVLAIQSEAGRLSETVAVAIGLSALFGLVALAVTLFLQGGQIMKKHHLEEEGPYPKALTAEVQAHVTVMQENFQPKYQQWLTLGIVLCVISPLPLILLALTQDDSHIAIGVGCLLLLVALGVKLIITVCMVSSCFKKLLRQDDYADAPQKARKLTVNISGLLWPLATSVFLISGFLFHAWGTMWIIFPLTAVLQGVIREIAKNVTRK